MGKAVSVRQDNPIFLHIRNIKTRRYNGKFTKAIHDLPGYIVVPIFEGSWTLRQLLSRLRSRPGTEPTPRRPPQDFLDDRNDLLRVSWDLLSAV